MPGAEPLRILWVTPVSLSSAIGKFSQLVVARLAALGETVVIGSCEPVPVSPDAAYQSVVPMILDPAEVLSRLDDFDVVIYNVGNNFAYHGSVIDQVRVRSGIFIFHDLYLHDLFFGVIEAAGKTGRHDAIVEATYGRRIQFAPDDPTYGAVLAHRVENYPMVEWFSGLALGCVVHGSFGVPILERASAGPVIHTFLAFYDPTADEEVPAAVAGHGGNDPIQLTTFGDANPNKRMASIIEAIGSSPKLRDAVRYSVVGRVTPHDEAHLRRLADGAGVNFEIIGRVTKKEWADRLAQTDIGMCLRYPTTETASATAIEGMLAGLPLIVTDTGFYRDLPDRLVFKVDPEREVDAIREQLERLVDDPELRAPAARESRAWAREAFSPVGYADRIKAFARSIVAEEPALELPAMLADVAVRLGMRGSDPIVKSWIQTADNLFAHDQSER